MAGHRGLLAWQRSMDLVVAAYTIGRTLRTSGHSDLARQLERAAVSVPANLAEGYGRSSPVEMARFLDISIGSLREVETLVEVGDRLRLLKSETVVALAASMRRGGKAAVRAQKEGEGCRRRVAQFQKAETDS